jgi:hypothetical protein
MSGGVIWAVLAGAPFVMISETLLAVWSKRPEWKPMQAAMAGMALRTFWMIVAMGIGLARMPEARAEFTVTLMAVYMAAQVAEGIRYQKFAESKA